MSNKTQLQTNNAALDGYIARINAAKEVATSLPEAGGSGGGSIETCTVTILGGIGITEQNMQVIASVYENNVITTVNKTAVVYFYPEDGVGSTSVTFNTINNTPVTLIFSETAPSSPVVTVGEPTFICNNGNTISFTAVPDSSSGFCSIVLQ